MVHAGNHMHAATTGYEVNDAVLLSVFNTHHSGCNYPHACMRSRGMVIRCYAQFLTGSCQSSRRIDTYQLQRCR